MLAVKYPPPSNHTVAGVVKDGWNGFNVIHESASRVAALDLGFQPSVAARSSKAPAKFVYLLGADDWEDAEVPADAFVVYQVRGWYRDQMHVVRVTILTTCMPTPQSHSCTLNLLPGDDLFVITQLLILSVAVEYLMA